MMSKAPRRADRAPTTLEVKSSDALDSPLLVCVVDGDERVRKRLNILLRTLDVAVEVFPTAEDFLETIQVDRADCLIVEVQLPGMSGIDLQRRLHDAGAVCPVILISHEGDIATAVNAIQLGGFDFIEKPFMNRVMLNLVTHALHS